MKSLKFATAAAFASIAFSSPSFATTALQDEPIVLSSAEMDEVTAGLLYLDLGFLQLNVAPVVITQIRVLNFEIGVNWTDTIQNVVQGAIRSRR